MHALEALAHDARALARGESVTATSAESEVARQMQICNACRYCEGFCAGRALPAQRRGPGVGFGAWLGVAGFLALAVAIRGSLWGAVNAGNFYAIFPHNLLVALFAPVFVFVVFALAMGVRRFWREVKPATSGAPLDLPAAGEATHDVLRLKYLDGGTVMAATMGTMLIPTPADVRTT